MKRRTTSGFTLLELLFAIIILGTMMSIVLVTITGMIRFYTFSNYVRLNQQNGRNTLDTMSREIRLGKLILPSASSAIDQTVLCVANEKDKRLIRYVKDGSSLRRIEYSYADKKLEDVVDCNGVNVTSTIDNQLVTPPRMYIKEFLVSRTGGAVITTDEAVAAVTIKMIYRSGNVNLATGDCDPGNIYCSPLDLNTAVNIRGKTVE